MKSLLESKDRQELEASYQLAKDKRTANRINAVLLRDDGYSCEEVAAILRLDDETVRRHEKSFHTLGLTEFLKSRYSGGKCKLNDYQLEELSAHLDENLCETTAEIIAHVATAYNVQYTTAGMADLLKRMGFVYKKPQLVPANASTSVQLEFIEYLEALRSSMGRKDKMYFVDGVHPQHNSVARCGWIRKGCDKSLKSNTGRERVNINGALDPDSLEVIARVDNTLDSNATIGLFKLIESRNQDAHKIVLFVDNARYYYNSEVLGYVDQSEKLEMVFIPPYSPNLNPIERLWKFMKKKTLYNRYYPSFKEFKEALGDFFMKLPEYYDELARIITEEFQIIGLDPQT